MAASHYHGRFQALTKRSLSLPPQNDQQIQHTLQQFGLTSSSFIQWMHSKAVEQQLIQGIAWLKAAHAGTPLFIIYLTKHPHHAVILCGDNTAHQLQKAIAHVSAQ
jgi:hypothetical protein